jgi:putative ABC transport system ATP-binding protein
MTALLADGVQLSVADGEHRVAILRGASLALEPYELVALAGPSGSGKSLLLDVLGGWLAPDSGRVRWGDTEQPPSWSALALVPQAFGLMTDLSVWHNLTLPLRLSSTSSGPWPHEVLERLGLSHLRQRSPDELSLGEQQRVAVARAAVIRPRVLLADEPTAHQDDASAESVLDLLRELSEAGTAVLVASHDPAVLASADRALQLRDGLVTPLPSAG